VLVADNTYYENINFKGKAITVASYYLIDGDTTHINNTIIDGSQPTKPDSGSVVFFVSGEDTTSVLCGFTITNGSGTETTFLIDTQVFCKAGGGIFCFNSGARITNNKITNNAIISPDKWVLGGGLAALPYESTAYVILQDNQIMRNTITANANHIFGGGMLVWCNAKLVNNIISFNFVTQNATDEIAQAGSGGVDIWCYNQNLIMERNKIAHNSIRSYSNRSNSTAFAGGCVIQGCQGRFTQNEVSHNEIWVKEYKNAVSIGIEISETADSFIAEGNIIRDNKITNGDGRGGGVGIVNCGSSMINNIITGNAATRGGGIFVTHDSTKFRLINNTITNNQASEYGGGIDVRSSADLFLMNSIIWDNQAPTDAAIHIHDNGTVQAAYCDIQGGWSGTMNINADPLFADTLFHLSDGSLCIGTGIHSYDFAGGIVCNCPPTDYDGNPRPNPVDEFVDMGAFETEFLKTGVEDKRELNPANFTLEQNYPNPFNPSTNIEFALPKPAFVTFKIYNLLGEEVATLVAEKREVGIHRLNWDARALASGVYVYRLKAGEFMQCKKLILMQ
jgi:hypothetical protein